MQRTPIMEFAAAWRFKRRCTTDSVTYDRSQKILVSDCCEGKWHVMPSDDVAGYFGAESAIGLPHTEAESRLNQWGLNRLRGKLPRPRWKLFLSQFNDTLVFVLIGAAILVGTIGGI